MPLDHLDLRTEPRQGWFEKAQTKKPDYKAECKSSGNGCYHGPRFEAHHVVPQTAIKKSLAEYLAGNDSGERKSSVGRYLKEVQWVTPWNINDPENMIGLPTFHSYAQYYAGEDGEFPITLSAQGEGRRARRLIKWFNKFTKQTRTSWASDFAGGTTPDGWIIHNPVCWGHTEYNLEVKQALYKEVWSQLDLKQKTHQANAKNVASNINTIRDRFLKRLKSRKTAKSLWQKRPAAWYEPYCMADVPDPFL
jgi:hypothetical protein